MAKAIPTSKLDETIPVAPHTEKYVLSRFNDTDCYSCILISDLRRTMKCAKLTPLENIVFECYVRGLGRKQIPLVLGRTQRSVNTSLRNACQKMAGAAVGTMTVIVEEFGIEAWSNLYGSSI